ncbi:MAG TPA: hypothetical protein DHV48_07720 [Prolixibacteraceae bacterium]|nr:hypothetical protein [Prolixibacteraceae bacterium]
MTNNAFSNEKVNELIKKIDEVRFKISHLEKQPEDIDWISTDEGLEKFLQKLVEKQNLATKTKSVYTINDLAKMFQVTSRTIYNWKEQGRLNFVQISSKTYVTSAQLEDFFKHNEVKSFKLKNS